MEGATPFAISGPFEADFLWEVHASQVRYYNAFGRRIHAYRLRVRGADGSEIEVHRRYSQFRRLVAAMPLLDMARLPPKSFWRLRFSSQFRDNRAEHLSTLVADALALDPFAVNMALRRFLAIAAPGQKAQAPTRPELVRRSTTLESIKELGCENGETFAGSSLWPLSRSTLSRSSSCSDKFGSCSVDQ